MINAAGNTYLKRCKEEAKQIKVVGDTSKVTRGVNRVQKVQF